MLPGPSPVPPVMIATSSQVNAANKVKMENAICFEIMFRVKRCRALGISGDQKIRRKLEKADKGSKVCKWVNSPAAHCLMSGWWAIHRWSPQTSKYQFQRSMYQSWAINDLPCPYIQKARVLVVRTPETATYFEFSPKKLDENAKSIKFALHWLLVLQPVVVSLKSCCVPSDPNPPWLYRAPPLVEEVS